MESRIQEFKRFHGIDRYTDQQFKLVYNDLFVLYNNEWIQLTKSNGSFYAKTILKKKYGRDFMRAIGLMPRYQPPSMDEIKSEMMYGYTNIT